ncbi:TetR/AcrR family transcriptional regulator [Dactylosporangium aurantiacum]|uniref:TetR/AcrR family transcriptional regulator n=1 Tax=Dactylosporangium aurantiacum TaxID=35754 RepID=A0A9Q9IDR9_9ACTN|nr:TetR/AcrR family transcriptional regulator [Dactylosporangium aurantiacum]MDG6108881.1 TetR/AcrR family transcriptional regulator [Dactylosporangium aurantiacum]UWZ52177.1 TetR/AcrR family transcriptional regulator [Dactylosporangium aurantiacum]
MPRGVAIAEPRQQLFAALERVVTAHGPARLTGRAVTREAGVATGLLYTHFADFDAFLTGYAVDRAFQLAAAVAGLPARAGTGTPAGNLADALLSTPLRSLEVSTRLTAYRPDLTAGVEAVLGAGTAGLAALEGAAAAYLAAEQRLGRIPAGTDTDALALAAVGVVHHAALTTAPGSDPAGRVRRALAAITGSSAATPS